MKLLNLCVSFLASAQAFAPSSYRSSFYAADDSSTMLRAGNIEQIEFKIFPDGRIEETVTGVKGGECHKITEEINKNLGKVVASKPTEELYEQEITIAQTVQVNNNDGGWEGSSTW
jgi:hypothetical protein|eukprot:scaffold604_cov270-Chaetoceros_neogracile.AAC.16